MKFKKLTVENNKFNLNLKFYYWLKHLVKTNLTNSQACDLLSKLTLQVELKERMQTLNNYSINIKGKSKSEKFYNLTSNIKNQTDIDIFIFSIKLYIIKDLLLAEAKLKNVVDIDAMSRLDPLSLAYDDKSLYLPYSTRVNGALLSLLFFDKIENSQTNFLSQDAQNYIQRLSRDAINLKKIGIEPNQIFMLMFSESINQSIISDSGSNYEERIFNTLTKIGIPANSIEKTHDKNDKSTEFDLFFELNNRTYGIGAKRTLRERYKQFIKTALSSNIDVMIEITLGLDLSEQKAKTIINHGTKIFVANEIYNTREYLKKLDGVYSVRDLTLKTLKSL
jgi:uncharacterized OsmC-like protein